MAPRKASAAVVEPEGDFVEKILDYDINAAIKAGFGQYALMTVRDRALPDARDGFKPVHRRILWGMWEGGYRSDKKKKKSAEVVGHIVGHYHPHGDTAVYDTAVRLAQPFSLRYPLIAMQGNMGSIAGDSAAASRYTEMHLTKLAEAYLRDIGEETVSMRQTYQQGAELEPDYLPARLPPIINPIEGIAVGLTTNVPPHNVGETLRACIALLDKREMGVDELMKYIKGPDFATGGTILGTDGIRDYLATGAGRIVLRGEVRREPGPRGNELLVITEIPAMAVVRNVNMKPDAMTVARSIGKAFNDGKVTGILLNDDRQAAEDQSNLKIGMRIVVTLAPGAQPAVVLNQLYKYTKLQLSETINMTFLFGDPLKPALRPEQVGMVRLLNYYNDHQLDILTRRTTYRLRRAEDRLHIVEGLIIGAKHARKIVESFQNADNVDAGKKEIMRLYKLSDRQATVIAEMALGRITKMNADQYQKEKDDLLPKIAYLRGLLDDRAKMVGLLKEEYQDLLKEFGDPRKTRVAAGAGEEVTEVADLIPREEILVSLSNDGYVKRLPADTYRTQKRGGKGVSGGALKGEDSTLELVRANSHDHIYLLTDQGRLYLTRGYEIPLGSRTARGERARTAFGLKSDESLRVMVPIADDEPMEGRFLSIFTKNGNVKRTDLTLYKNMNSAGLNDMKLIDDDVVVSACLSDGTMDFLVVTSDGQALRFPEGGDRGVRATGRGGQGVGAIVLNQGARVVSAAAVPATGDKGFLFTIATNGFGKRTKLSEFEAKNRKGKGIIAITLTNKAEVAAARVVGVDGDLIVASEKGIVTRMPVKQLATSGRATKGTRVMNVAAADRVVTMSEIPGDAN